MPLLSREQILLVTGNRPSSNIKLKAIIKQDGTLTALQSTLLGSGAPFDSGGISLTDWLVRELYTCPNVKCESTEALINADPACPFRAPGHPEGAWALEQMMDALAEKIGMEPVELLLKNIPLFSQTRQGNPTYTSTGLRRMARDDRPANPSIRHSRMFLAGIQELCAAWIPAKRTRE